jgi:hypothetical protein
MAKPDRQPGQGANEQERRTAGQVIGRRLHTLTDTLWGNNTRRLATVVVASAVGLAACSSTSSTEPGPTGKPSSTGSDRAVPGPTIHPTPAESSAGVNPTGGLPEVKINALVATPDQYQGFPVLATGIPASQVTVAERIVNGKTLYTFTLPVGEREVQINGRNKRELITQTGLLMGVSTPDGTSVMPFFTPGNPDGSFSPIDDIVFTTESLGGPLGVAGKLITIPADTDFGQSLRKNGDPSGEMFEITYAVGVANLPSETPPGVSTTAKLDFMPKYPIGRTPKDGPYKQKTPTRRSL